MAILLGLVPKFGAVVSATPGGVLGGITVVLYGMIGLLGAKIWIENKVNFANPVNLVPIAAGIIIGVGGVAMSFGNDFVLSGIALGSIVAIVGLSRGPAAGAEGTAGAAASRRPVGDGNAVRFRARPAGPSSPRLSQRRSRAPRGHRINPGNDHYLLT